MSASNLVGLYFHSFESDGKRIAWQGVVSDIVSDGLMLVTLFNWISGNASHHQIVYLGDMTTWHFYDDVDAMKQAYDVYNRNNPP